MRDFNILVIVFSFIVLKISYGKPSKILTSLRPLDSITDLTNDPTNTSEILRKQRSPIFLDDYDDDDYSYEEDDGARHLLFGHKRKKHKPLLGGFLSGHGCRGGYNCGGWQPDYGGHYQGHQPASHGGSFATASAGSLGNGGGGPHGPHSEANAQSASFSFGPYTATFSVAQASSGRNQRY
ncbi:uncharacterized protein [Prorops nasuta]|uniref:uncharacterized protein n=1 Tax=Prorops nasuta TaxID=863751 RepID=UPI0034CF6880